MLYSLENAKHSEIMLENLENCEQNQENVSYISFTIYVFYIHSVLHTTGAPKARRPAQKVQTLDDPPHYKI